MANFSLQGTPGKLGLAFPAIETVLGVGPILAVIVGFLNPIIFFFEIVVAIAKFALFLALLPLMCIVFLIDLLTNAIKDAFDGLLAMINQFKGLSLSAGLSEYKFTGQVAHFGAAATSFFAPGLPGVAPDPTHEVYGVFLVAVNTSSLSGIQQLFGAGPVMPPALPGPAPKVNALGGDKDNKSATLTLAGPGHIIGNWTNTVNVPARYQLRIQDLTATLPAVPPAAAVPVYVALSNETHADHTVTPVYTAMVDEAGIHHQYMFPDPVTPLVAGHQYLLEVTLVDDAGAAIPPVDKAINPQLSDATTYSVSVGMPARPTPAAPLPLPVPVSSEIVFQGREGFAVVLPGLGGLTDAIVAIETPIKTFENLITSTLGRFKTQYDAILAMMDFWTKQIDDLHASVTFLQNLVQQFATFTLHFGGAMEVGTVWFYHYQGPIGELGATMAPVLAAGLAGSPDAAGPTQVIQCEFILAEDPVNAAILKFLTGG